MGRPVILVCAACGTSRLAGELLLVSDRQGQRPAATVCRPGVSAGCTDWAGSAAQTTIALLDAAAAREFDRSGVAAGTPVMTRTNERSTKCPANG